MGLVPPEVGGHQAVGDQPGIGVGHADGGQHGGGELGQPPRVDPGGGLRAVLAHRTPHSVRAAPGAGVAEPLTHQVRKLVNSRIPAAASSRP